MTQVVDVRAFPRSRRNPQFNLETLPGSLATAGIGYVHLPGLGGRRQETHDSPNAGWRHASFRAYADYMRTPEFQANLEMVVKIAENQRVALLCAEAVPWRCHRRLIADALLVQGRRVEHILGAARTQAHVLVPWAKVEGTELTYPASSSGTQPDQTLH